MRLVIFTFSKIPNLMRNYDLYRNVIKISNDLSSLIPIGTLHFYNMPFERSDLGGIQVLNSQWRWLDIDVLVALCGDSVHDLLKDLQFLMIYRYVMATYRFIRKNGLVIAKVRIYAVPFDIQGSRFFNEWRSSRPKYLNLSKNFKLIWHNMITYIDYSSFSWSKLSLKHLLLIPCKVLVSKHANLNLGEAKYHISRWYSNKTTILSDTGAIEHNLTEKVANAYNNIPSPDISRYYHKSKLSRINSIPSAEDVIIDLVHNMLEGNNFIPGVKTQLYPFQVKSLSKMYERETLPEKTLVPNFIRLKSPESQSIYYFDILNTAFYLKPELFQQPRGGILAENMGLGKTLICLSLICLTKWELSTLPEDYLTVMKDDTDVQEMVIDYEKNILVPKYPLKNNLVPKLTDLCRKVVNQNSLPWRYYQQHLPESVINKLVSAPGYFRIPLENSEYVSPFSIKRSRKSDRIKYLEEELPSEGRTFKTLFFCNTTLIVVPDNLFHQWNNELKKHIEPSFLKKLFISNQFRKKIVSENGTFTNEVYENPSDLTKFDLIVISISILSKQFDERDDNPLLKVFWKRLIIDEGHSMNSRSSRAGLLSREMHTERRWAVTGTPTSGLTRLHMDEEDEEGKLITDSPSKRKNKYVVKNNFNEKDDLAKLGNLISNFLKIEPFHSQPKLWQSTMVKPLVFNLYGSSTSLSNLLNAIVVRHSLDEVETDIKLPQLHHVSVFLKPSFHNKLAINIFTAVLAVNAVSSERKDIDYMFHPSNRQQLRRLITNVQRATFHWSGFKQEDIEALVHVCKISLEKKDKKGNPFYKEEDIELLKKSMEMAKMALSNPRWRTISLLHEMNYFISGLPDVFTKTFGIGVLENKNNDIGIFGAPHISALQEFFYKNRFMNFNDDQKLIEKLEEVSKPFWSNYWEDTMKKNNQKFNKVDKSEEYNDSDIIQQRIHENMKPKTKQSSSPTKRKNSLTNSSKSKTPKITKTSLNNSAIKIETENTKSELQRQDGEGLKITNEINTLHSLAKHNISYEAIKNSIILGTASSKLSYLSSKLLENQKQKIKSIVFFEFEDSAYYLTELLDILGVNYILYATFINTAQRAENLAEFSDYSSENNGGIVLIMDLRLAAHGLTIIAATKVYFISPVWQRSVEAQAIKRAHRIGQTKEVYVETLVLEDTLEEEIYKKRLRQQDQKDDEKKKFVIDDTGMQDFILRHNFLSMDSSQEYAPFEAPTTDDTKYAFQEEFDDPSSLAEHEDTIEDHVRKWKIFLFNRDNLSKLNALKNQKITKEYMKDKFIQNMTNDEEIKEVKTEKKVKIRKTVRF